MQKEDKKERCSGMSKRSRKRCQNYPINGRTTCRMHNGKAKKGFASPRFKHGRYSRDIPTRFALKHEEALSDPELLSLRSDIALNEAFMHELLQQFETGEAGDLWHNLHTSKQAYDQAAYKRDIGAMHRALDQIGNLIDRGAAQVTLMREISNLMEKGRQLRESESKRLINTQQMITSERASAMIGVITNILMTVLRKHFDDKTVRMLYADISLGLDAHVLSASNGQSRN